MSREIPLSMGHVAIVDDEDYERVMAAGPWRLYLRDNYALRGIPHPDGGFRVNGRPRRTTEPLHRFLTGYELTDHINGDGLDNRRENLRPATPRQNAANARLSARNTSGFRGVSLERPGKWRANIEVHGKRVYLGAFADKQQAALAYDAAAREVHGEFARLNFPRPGELPAREPSLNARAVA